MQTFLPFPDFALSARALDNRRLGKQRVEVIQILNALQGNSKGWRHHPATLMWQEHEHALIAYGLVICGEWKRRGFKDTCLYQLLNRWHQASGTYAVHIHDMVVANKPEWLGDPAFHLSHQSNLIRKDPAFYGPKFPGVPDNLPYVWPVRRN